MQYNAEARSYLAQLMTGRASEGQAPVTVPWGVGFVTNQEEPLVLVFVRDVFGSHLPSSPMHSVTDALKAWLYENRVRIAGYAYHARERLPLLDARTLAFVLIVEPIDARNPGETAREVNAVLDDAFGACGFSYSVNRDGAWAWLGETAEAV